MPSLIGPTNIPPWEAFKMNVPVIYSKSNGIKEVLEDAAYYVNPLESESIARGIKEIFENNELKNNLVTKGRKKLEETKAKNLQSVRTKETWVNLYSPWVSESESKEERKTISYR